MIKSDKKLKIMLLYACLCQSAARVPYQISNDCIVIVAGAGNDNTTKGHHWDTKLFDNQEMIHFNEISSQVLNYEVSFSISWSVQQTGQTNVQYPFIYK